MRVSCSTAPSTARILLTLIACEKPSTQQTLTRPCRFKGNSSSPNLPALRPGDPVPIQDQDSRTRPARQTKKPKRSQPKPVSRSKLSTSSSSHPAFTGSKPSNSPSTNSYARLGKANYCATTSLVHITSETCGTDLLKRLNDTISPKSGDTTKQAKNSLLRRAPWTGKRSTRGICRFRRRLRRRLRHPRCVFCCCLWPRCGCSTSFQYS